MNNSVVQNFLRKVKIGVSYDIDKGIGLTLYGIAFSQKRRRHVSEAFSFPGVDAGSWRSPSPSQGRLMLPVFRGGLYPRGASVYSVSFDKGFIDGFWDLDVEFRNNVKNLENMVRYRVTPPPLWPLEGSSFRAPTYLYCKTLNAAGQFKVSKTISGYLHMINRKFFRFLKAGKVFSNQIDDFVRVHLSYLTKWAFPKTFSHGPAFQLLTALELMGGKAPVIKEDMIDNITNWVSGDKPLRLDRLKPHIDKLFSTWTYKTDASVFLTFREFCNDPFRWGTSGGAAPTHMYGEKFRSKWAWALLRVIDTAKNQLRPEYDLYSDAVAEPPVCKVALKEEPKKARAIISTTMASYLRQSYLVYRWNRYPGESPISRPGWVNSFQKVKYDWYACIDAERFDQSISKEAIVYILNRLGQVDEDCAAVAREEIKHLDDLTVEWAGRVWKYEGGLLSGMRITSIVGTVLSGAAGQYVVSRVFGDGTIPPKVCSMGDDLVLAGFGPLPDKQMILSAYAETGFSANPKKTVISQIGDYLRAVYSPRSISYYPANVIGTLSYANPWLNVFNFESEKDQSTSWMTLYSRMLPHCVTPVNLSAFIFQNILASLVGRGFSTSSLTDWLSTPISAGGGGCLEWSDQERWTEMSVSAHPGNEADFILSFFNIISSDSRRLIRSTKKLKPIDAKLAQKMASGMNRLVNIPDDIIPVNVNKTKVILEWYFNRRTVSWLQTKLKYRIPRYMRVYSYKSIFEHLMGLELSPGGVTSVQTTLDGLQDTSRFSHTLGKMLSSNHRFNKIGSINAATTLYILYRFRNSQVVSGTW